MIRPRRFSRFRLACFAAFERCAVLMGGRRFYHWRYLAPGRLRVREEVIEVPGLHEDLDGWTLAHLSDVHAGPFLGAGALAHAVELVAERAPEVVCWTGDYVTHGVQNLTPVLPELRRATGRRATFAVFGNHDYRHRREGEIVAALEPSGWRFLRNDGEVVTHGRATVGFIGIEDPEEGKVVDVEAAVSRAQGADLVVALSHGPGAAPAFARRGVRLVLAGHTHGTQVDLPVLRRLGPAHPGLRVELGGCTLLVTRGLGAIGLPVRWGVPAEVVFVRLRRISARTAQT